MDKASTTSILSETKKIDDYLIINYKKQNICDVSDGN